MVEQAEVVLQHIQVRSIRPRSQLWGKFGFIGQHGTGVKAWYFDSLRDTVTIKNTGDLAFTPKAACFVRLQMSPYPTVSTVIEYTRSSPLEPGESYTVLLGTTLLGGFPLPFIHGDDGMGCVAVYSKETGEQLVTPVRGNPSQQEYAIYFFNPATVEAAEVTPPQSWAKA